MGGEVVSFGKKQAEILFRGMTEYKNLLEIKLEKLAEEAKHGTIGASSEYARVQVELGKVKKILERLGRVIQ